jgi:hypothetical protein
VTTFSASPEDVETVARMLGRRPAGRFRVVCRRTKGEPVVIENAPHLDDGTPMPTLYWLVDPSLREQVSRIESVGGVRRLEAELDPEAIAQAHLAYAERRATLVAVAEAPQPSGGVGGTRRGLKCLHAHLAAYLAGLDDPVGIAVANEVDLAGVVRGAVIEGVEGST